MLAALFIQPHKVTIVEQTTIVYPAIAMFALSISMIFLLGISRFVAIHRRQVSVKFYRTYQEGKQPDRLHVLGRHVQNHFEVPPMFYAGVILSYVTGSVTGVALIAAWSFVALRALHAVIHLGSNNVSQRFFCFGLSLIALTVIWGNLLLGVMP